MSSNGAQSLISRALDLLSPREIHDALTPKERLAIRFCWRAHRRPLFLRETRTILGGERRQIWGGQEPPPGNWVVWLVSAGRGFGKALALDTKIPTPSGWTTMGELRVGDVVFDESGRQCNVTATFDTFADVAYRVRFSDGSFIDACSEHQWVTWTHADRKEMLRRVGASEFPPDWPAWRLSRKDGRGAFGPAIRNTQQIADTATYGKRGDTNHCIPVCAPLDLASAALPVDPYVLGCWLGDGSSRTGEITVSDADSAEMFVLLESRGCSVNLNSARRKDGAGCATYGIGQAPERRDSLGRITANGSLQSRLRALGVIRNKHIPEEYLRASAEQRLDLLRGLMDTDGSASASGHVEFAATNERLARDVVELARTLGQKPAFSEGRASVNGRDVGAKYRVCWTPTLNVFGLSRKASRLRLSGAQSLRNHHRMIVSVERIDPQPMRCITVDSKHSMYLAGDAMVPTHNTRLGAEWIRERAMRFPGTRWAIVGETNDEARKVMLKGESGLLSVCAPWERPHFNFTDQSLEFSNGSTVYLYSAEKPEKFRGPQFHGAWLDEFPKWRRMRDAWDHIRFGVRLPLRGDRPRVVITTTPRPNKLLKEIRERASTVVTEGSTYENQANLDQSFLDELANWKDSKLGQQEIFGRQFDEAPGAIFLARWIDEHRRAEAPRMRRIVVAVDPTSSDTDRSDETGIVVCGLGDDGRGYVLHDASIRATPDRWARRAVEAYRHWGADCIVAETTMGGDLVPSMIKLVDPLIPVKIKGGNRGKVSRAEPVAALYEQGKISHVGGFDDLENQMTNYTLGARESPDRMDAMVYAISELMLPKDVPLAFR